ncbi:MAG TPA: hypothetical protein VF756_02670 [Thermoanaerobaculia bacterium]
MAHHGLHRVLVYGAAALFLTTGLFAQQMREGSDPLSRLSLSDPRLRPSPAVVPLSETGASLAAEARSSWTGFLRQAGGEWKGFADRRSGRLEMAEGSGIPWIPGRGNRLALADIDSHLRGGQTVDLSTLESVARGFLPRVAPLLGVDPDSLVLNRGRSGLMGDALWLVDFDVRRDGRTVEGARVVFRVSHGNLVQFGTESLPSPDAPAPREQVTRQEALEALTRHVGGFSAADQFLDGGSLHLLSAAVQDSGFAEGFEPGNGRGLALVWEFLFQRQKVTGTWRARVDAVSGQVIELYDVNRYAKISGGVYLDSYATGSEVSLPMPFADIATTYANAAGVYTFFGPVQSMLNSLYVWIQDSCGPISQSSSGVGRIDFGSSPGTDCATPGHGGAGNTHSARTQFYHVNRAKEIARGWLPTNSWLDSRLQVNVNIFDSCNAYWDGSINFFRSGSGCGNTGEIVGVSLHEYGHGLDANDGNGLLTDLGTAETYGDFTAALTTHRSCMGDGFFQTEDCGGYGDPCTSCSGVRDIDWARRQSNTPHTVGNFTQPLCPFGGGYDGPCGREGHCESYVSSEALWDLAARDLPGAGGPAAWAVVERLWYLSRPTATNAFTCQTGTTPWTSNGCNTGSLWRTMRAVDDDDGNLANGTPHSCHLFAAFNRHGIACAADAGANVCFSGCTPPAAPALSAGAVDGEVELSWSSSGAGVVYDVYKTELGCDSGFIKIANNLTGTSLTDGVVTDGPTYSYQVIAHPAGSEACGSAPSACQSVAPEPPPCLDVQPPADVTATAAGFQEIDISWTAVPQATLYIILRATTPGGPYTEAGAVAAPATSWEDQGLATGTTYYYVVKAFSGCESESSEEVSATTQVCVEHVLYSNDFETGSGLSDWTAESLNGGSTADWRGIQSCTAHSGSKIFRFGGSTCAALYADSQRSFAKPQGTVGIVVPPGVAETRLSFWHRWSFEYGYDGGTLMLSVDGGNAVTIPASAIVAGATYNAQSYLTNQPIFTSFQGSFVNTVADLDTACDLATGGTGGCGGHTLSIRFTTLIDSSVIDSGWFLDDVMVTFCGASCTAPGSPQNVDATTPADNQAQVSWSQGAPAAQSFNVYRATGSCASPGSFTRIGTHLAGTSHLDAPLQGTLTYAYRVTGLDETGFCESAPSACADATATGPCTLPLSFAGLASAATTTAQVCGVQLSWTAASSPCGHAITYDVYRSTSPSFTPGEANRIAAGVAATSYVDTGLLTDSTTYYYVVRAVDAVTGVPETNTVRRNATTRGPDILRTITETFEGSQSGGGFDNPGWQHAALLGPNDWVWSTVWTHSPLHAWLSPSYSSTADRVLVSPSFGIEAGTTLSFWHTYEFDGCWDGGTLEISIDGGQSWEVLPDSAFTMGGFTGTLYSGSPIGNLRGWCEGTLGPMSEVRADLSGWAGSSDARLRWHAGEDHVIRYPGWYVDDVTIADTVTIDSCQPSITPHDFYTLTPCRLVDTRQPNGPRGGPVLQPAAIRAFALAGACGIPPTAKALSVNMTVVQPTSFGHLALYPDGHLTPNTSSINFQAGQTRANSAIVGLGDGNGAIRVHAATGGTVHFILDVNGYFE